MLSRVGLVALLVPTVALAAPPASVRLLDNVRAIGDATAADGIVTVKAPRMTLVLGADGAESYRLTTDLLLADKAGGVSLQVMPTDPADINKPAALYASFSRDAAGILLQSSTYNWDDAKKQWAGASDVAYSYYWRDAKDAVGQSLLKDGGLQPRNLKDQWLLLRVEADRTHVNFWLDGRLIRRRERPAWMKGPVALLLNQGDRVRNVRVEPLAESVFQPVDLSREAHEKLAAPLGKDRLEHGGVPFEPAGAGTSQVNLRTARWIEEKSDPADYYEHYDAGPPILHDPRVPFLRVPLADYTAAHVLAVADDDPATVNALTLRAGRYGWSDQTHQQSYLGTVPRRAEAASVPAGQKLDTPAGTLFHAVVPMTTAIAQDLDRFLDVELTKEFRLARRVPDPCRFRSRPLGLPSGVRIIALTLEKSPLQMRVGSKESGHAFVEPQKPVYQVRLQNVTSVEQQYALTLRLRHRDGTTLNVDRAGRVPAGQTAEVELAVPTAKRGYYDTRVVLASNGRTLLQRDTSCCLLPPDTRRHRESSPFGTWDFCGAHFTPNDPDITGPLYVKLGLRYGMFSFPAEKRKKWGVLGGYEPNIYEGGLKAFEEYLGKNPDVAPIGLIFHETAVNAQQVTKVPDLFHAGPTAKFSAEDEKKLKDLMDKAIASARAIKAKYPKSHLRIGNGTTTMKEDLYRAKFPPELFDSAGNEAGCFGRPPEAQPPDSVTLNGSLWVDRQLLDHYGYKDKAVTMCVETGYPATSPGNLSLNDQADYLVRHGLHALAWNIPHIKLGQICDMGNSYYFSNWGAIGFTRYKPELNVKPSFVSFATMTRVLDGAKYVRTVPTGSPSLYVMEFARPDGARAHALWTLRGKRTVQLAFDAAGPLTRVDDQGTEETIDARGDAALSLTLTPSPIYLVGKPAVKEVKPGESQYAERPAGKSAVLAPLAALDGWELEQGRDPELEIYDFMCPRRKGDFAFEPAVAFEGKEPSLRVTPRPIKHGKETMPMVAALRHSAGLPVPGTPTEIGCWVNGNSGWGRLMFELTDASGQRWISLGAEQPGVPRKWVDDLLPKELHGKWATPAINDWNTGDVFGVSRINFDGWRWVAFPLPGNYPGEKHPWPANSQWRWDRDGVVHYPLTFRRLIVELPEKVLQVKTFAAPPRPEIYVRGLTVGQDDRQLGYVPGPDR